MSDDNYQYVQLYEGSYLRIVNEDGVRTTFADNRFEVEVLPRTEINEQSVVKKFRDWIRWRKREEELREPSSVSR
jgi:hypothetical protein